MATQQSTDWDPTRYLTFSNERTRPALELLSRVPLTHPKRIIDLGCGPGNSTSLLASRYPSSNIEGMDSSPNMLSQAREILPNLRFTQADLTTFEPDQQTDLLFSNAVFQWIPADQRLDLIKRLLTTQPSGGVFAFQVPDNLAEPSHTLMTETASSPGPWKETLDKANPGRDSFQSPQELYDAFKPLCSEIDIWHTHYQHRLDNHEAIVNWLMSTGLRPFLDPLDKEQRQAFLDDYLGRIKRAYPISVDGAVLLKFPRLFVVLHRL